MKTTLYCTDCLGKLVQRTIKLSGGDEDLLAECRQMIKVLVVSEYTPPDIANRLLRRIREKTGMRDPFVNLKNQEAARAQEAMQKIAPHFHSDLKSVLKLSALGNSSDFFVDPTFEVNAFRFVANMDKIENEIYNKGKNVLLIGDNISDFFFDMPLVKFLEEQGKRVSYAVREHPVQNDLSMDDVKRLELNRIFDNIVSTGTDEVGVRPDNLEGEMKELWEKADLIVAKGMGNYETLSEYRPLRPLLHIMKIKCAAVAEDVNRTKDTHTVITGGEIYGSKKRLL